MSLESYLSDVLEFLNDQADNADFGVTKELSSLILETKIFLIYEIIDRDGIDDLKSVLDKKMFDSLDDGDQKQIYAKAIASRRESCIKYLNELV
jgi:hypothetical protein